MRLFPILLLAAAAITGCSRPPTSSSLAQAYAVALADCPRISNCVTLASEIHLDYEHNYACTNQYTAHYIGRVTSASVSPADDRLRPYTGTIATTWSTNGIEFDWPEFYEPDGLLPRATAYWGTHSKRWNWITARTFWGGSVRAEKSK